MTHKKRNKQQSPTVVTASEERWHVWVVTALCAVGFFIYFNTLSSTFHFDDLAVIINNPAIRHLWDLPSIFHAFNTRFLTGWTFAVNYSLGQLDVFGYHFFNIWLHICNSVLVYTLILQFLNLDVKNSKISNVGKIGLAGAAAFVFLTHPIQTQAVNYIWQRTTLLATFFYLSTLILYIQGRISSLRSYYYGSLGCSLMALFSKEISFTLPLMVVMIEWLFLQHLSKDKRGWLWMLPFVLMLLIIPVSLQKTQVTLAIMRPHSIISGVAPDIMLARDYWLAQVNAIRTYLQLFIWPVGQTIDHDFPLVSVSGWGGWWFSLTLVSLIVGTGIAIFKRHPIVTFCVLWFFLTLSVESIVTSADILVEHRLYLPSVALCFAFAYFMYYWVFTKNVQIAIALVVTVSLIFGVMTVDRNAIWLNDITLWSDAIQKSPNKARAYNNRGVIYKQLNFVDLAFNDFNRAITVNPQYPEAYYNRGGIYKMKANWKAAAQDYQKVIELEPTNFQGYDARGYLYRRQGQFKEALEDFAMSIALNPNNPEVFNNRAYIYQKQNRRDLAIADYSRAIEADPAYIYAYNNRGNLYLETSQYDLAISDYTRAISLKPDFGESHVNRAVANFKIGRLKESLEDVNQAKSLGLKANAQFLQELNEAIHK